MPTTHAADFLALHARPQTFVLPNVWDAGSAKVVAQAGFSALGTTSAGIAFAAGLPDDGRIGATSCSTASPPSPRRSTSR